MARTGAALILVTLLAVHVVNAQQSKPAFDVVSVRPTSNQPTTTRTTPETFYRRSANVASLIWFAYGISPTQLSGGPDWIRKSGYEINAKSSREASPDEIRLMVQSLLEDRFKLVVHEERREMVYQALRLRRNDGQIGPKLEKCDPAVAVSPKPIMRPVGAYMLPLSGSCAPAVEIANTASLRLNTVVVDETGLQGLWNYLVWYAEPSSATTPSELPSLPIALEEELGLRLVSTKGPQKMLVIDSIQPPTEN